MIRSSTAGRQCTCFGCAPRRPWTGFAGGTQGAPGHHMPRHHCGELQLPMLKRGSMCSAAERHAEIAHSLRPRASRGCVVDSRRICVGEPARAQRMTLVPKRPRRANDAPPALSLEVNSARNLCVGGKKTLFSDAAASPRNTLLCPVLSSHPGRPSLSLAWENTRTAAQRSAPTPTSMHMTSRLCLCVTSLQLAAPFSSLSSKTKSLLLAPLSPSRRGKSYVFVSTRGNRTPV
jgi:hypothetical protein